MTLAVIDAFTTQSGNWAKMAFLDNGVWSRPEAPAMIFIVNFVLKPLFEHALELDGMASCFGMSFSFVTPSCLAVITTDQLHTSLMQGFQTWRVVDFLMSTRHMQPFRDYRSTIYDDLGQGRLAQVVLEFVPTKGLCGTSANSWIKSSGRPARKLLGKMMLHISACPNPTYIHKVRCACKVSDCMPVCGLLYFNQDAEALLFELYQEVSLGILDTKDPVLTLLARSLAWIAQRVAGSDPLVWVQEAARRIEPTEGATQIFAILGKGLQFVVDQLGKVKVFVMFEAVC